MEACPESLGALLVLKEDRYYLLITVVQTHYPLATAVRLRLSVLCTLCTVQYGPQSEIWED